jgi:DNA (cytosine-5)-methyltransferase 1
MIDYISAFRGMGGVEKALEQIGGFNCVGAFEIDSHANLFSDNYYKKVHNHGDITKVDAKSIACHSWLIGGFCCQPFSVAGIRQGFKDKIRGTVFFDLARIIEAKQPSVVVLENVRGLVSHAKGQTLSVVINTLAELGYRCEWGLLNSKDFGVPHHRVRWYLVARHLRTEPTGAIFPLGQSNQEDTRRAGEHLSYCLDANYWKGTNTTLKGRRQLIQINKPTHSNNRVYDPDGLSPTLNTMQGGNRQPFILTEVRTEEAKRIRREIKAKTGKDHSPRRGKKIVPRTDGLCGTLTTSPTIENTLCDGAKVRRLTPLECFRLQGFPDDAYHKAVELGISNTQMYKMCGNAITVPVFKALAERILEVTQPTEDNRQSAIDEDRADQIRQFRKDQAKLDMYNDPIMNWSGLR